jgi:uncharacterized short protein YbdD (DUF466 family)
LVNSAEGTLLFYLPKEQHSEPKRKMTRREYNNYREDLRYTEDYGSIMTMRGK